MPDSDAALKGAITTFLRASGPAVEDIPETSQMTPDLFVECGKSDSLLVEIKTKEDDPKEIADLSLRLKSGGVVGRSKGTHHWNTLGRIIEKAVRQMETHDPTHTSHHILWFHCIGIDASVAEVRMEATLYGTQKLWSSEIRGLITAYYFTHNAFHRFASSLDGVVISREGQAQFHLNPFSPRLPVLQATKFASILGSPVIPAEISGEKNLMICGASAPRGDVESMLAHLRQLYDLSHLQTMNMGFISGWIERPEREADVEE